MYSSLLRSRYSKITLLSGTEIKLPACNMIILSQRTEKPMIYDGCAGDQIRYMMIVLGIFSTISP